jgi:hypothetical protein
VIGHWDSIHTDLARSADLHWASGAVALKGTLESSEFTITYRADSGDIVIASEFTAIGCLIDAMGCGPTSKMPMDWNATRAVNGCEAAKQQFAHPNPTVKLKYLVPFPVHR